MKLRILPVLALLFCLAQHTRAQWPYVPIVQSNSKSQNAASIIYGSCGSFTAAGSSTINSPFTRVGNTTYAQTEGYQVVTTATGVYDELRADQ